MDYLPLNLPKNHTPVHIFPPTIGAYESWLLQKPRFCYFKCIEVIEVARCNSLSRLSQDQLAIRYGYTEGLDPASLTAELPFLIDPFF